LLEFAKSAIKLVLVTAVLIFILKGQIAVYSSTLGVELWLLPKTLLELTAEVLSGLTVLALLLAMGDLVLARLKWRHDLRMTRHEIKEEMKQSEGDPLMKARIRSIARQRTSRRMLKKLPGASMVIVNPTHFAVALRYAREEGGAPVVVAKGVDHMALKIREIAGEHSVPIVEDKPLARALYESVEIDMQIPSEFYRAVAEILHYLNSRKRLPQHRGQH
jgi:flagellar biosynthetic protein FlhB